VNANTEQLMPFDFEFVQNMFHLTEYIIIGMSFYKLVENRFTISILKILACHASLNSTKLLKVSYILIPG
jgi:hypothetical protein